MWLPAWTRLDLSARYVTQVQGQTWTAVLGVDNATDANMVLGYLLQDVIA